MQHELQAATHVRAWLMRAGHAGGAVGSVPSAAARVAPAPPAVSLMAGGSRARGCTELRHKAQLAGEITQDQPKPSGADPRRPS